MFKDSKAFSSFSVSDIDVAFTFYTETLGLDVDKTPQGLMVQFAHGGSVFMYPKDNHVAATFTVLNFQVPDIERAVTDLTGNGVTMEQYDMGFIKTDERGIARIEGGPAGMAWFKDPAGNVIGVMQE